MKNRPTRNWQRLSDETKCVICLALTIIMGLLLFYTYIGDQESDYTGIIRLHVIADSNAPEDQALKLKVRDAIIEYMDQQGDLEDVDEMREYLASNLDRFERIADGVIASEGCDQTARADMGIRYIPERTYGDITFPAGNYEALNITIGSGQGENWWCVLFPPLCLLDEGTEPAAPDISEERASDAGASDDGTDEADVSGDVSDENLTGEAAGSDSLTGKQLYLRWKLLELLQKNGTS